MLAVIWSSWIPLLREAASSLSVELAAYSTQDLGRYEVLRSVLEEELDRATIALFYRTSDPVWTQVDDVCRAYKERVPIVVVGSTDQRNVYDHEVAATVYRYLLFGGRENMLNLLKYLIHHFIDPAFDYRLPTELPWEGLWHPHFPQVFTETDAYLSQYLPRVEFEPTGWVGLLYSRSDWVTGNTAVVHAIIEALEKRHWAVIPAFFYPLKDKNLGNLSGWEVINRYFVEGDKSLVDGIVRLTSFPLSAAHGETDKMTPDGVNLLTRLNVPLFCPVISYYQTGEMWWSSEDGLGSQVAWSLAMPEFEGAIEPLVVGVVDDEGSHYVPIAERMERFAHRVSRWLTLKKKPNREKKVVFVLHNNPCASLEATIGAGAHLDTMESVVNIMKRMAEMGYAVTPPPHGQALREEILRRKAISEFRWTTVSDIVASGGAIALVEREEYENWWQEIPAEAREKMRDTWGEPPGEAMVHDGRIVVTGVRYGNVMVCVQPKRGCAGARCDGRVCKILHDPLCPPPHQYLATYWWLAKRFGADAIIHVGTHGNLEFLPGKGTGLSAKCFPDMGIHSLPHLYIYNADNPPEGTVAKRRAYACLVDHMQTVMVSGSLYGEGEKLYKLLSEYEELGKEGSPVRLNALKPHLISLAGKMGLHAWTPDGEITDEIVKALRAQLELMRSTALPDGMHVMGNLPQGERLVDFVWSILRYESGAHSLKGLLRHQGTGERKSDEDLDHYAREVCRKHLLEGQPLYELLGGKREVIDEVENRMADLCRRLRASDEIGALLNGLDAGFVPPGPSGLITRGDDRVLPTGRNFYSFDPRLIPSPLAWEIGKTLAEKMVEKYKGEKGNWPENIAFYWQCTDIMWSKGEGMGQMLYLLGVKPRWDREGKIAGLEVVPLRELGRPRIDITVRVSGITRDNFPSAIALLDEAVKQVALLDEPVEMNFVRKHTLEKLAGVLAPTEGDLRRATFRIFASMPGTYQAGTQLAVYASAWETDKDLAQVFLYWNGYAYGRGVMGEAAHRELASSLATVDASFNRAITDEYDLTGCCSMFGVHGGMINAARVISGRQEIKNYYGDTRDISRVSIRTLEEEIRRVARAKLLHPRWIEGMKRHGYQGAGEIMKRVGRLYGWQATTGAVDGAIFDDVVKVFIMDKENREYFAQHNPWAIEEMARRLLEAEKRGLWRPSEEVREALEMFYLEIEGYVEETIEDPKGERQGGNVDIVTSEEILHWKEAMKEVMK